MKSDSLTKSDLAWLAIRAVGLLFVWVALTKVAMFIYAVYRLTSEGWSEISDSLGSRLSWEIAWPPAIHFILSLLAALYFLKGGRFIHRILLSLPKNTESADPDES